MNAIEKAAVDKVIDFMNKQAERDEMQGKSCDRFPELQRAYFDAAKTCHAIATDLGKVAILTMENRKGVK